MVEDERPFSVRMREIADRLSDVAKDLTGEERRIADEAVIEAHDVARKLENVGE